jgi:hypothetical protein
MIVFPFLLQEMCEIDAVVSLRGFDSSTPADDRAKGDTVIALCRTAASESTQSAVLGALP